MWRFLMIMAVAALTSSCFVGLGDVNGDGTIVTEDRDHSGFDAVSLSGVGDMTLAEGDFSVTIRTDANLMEYIETSVRGSTLVIEQRNLVNLDPTDGIEFIVTLPELTRAEVSGVGQITVDALEAERLDIEVSGVGGVDIADLVADRVIVELSGVGSIDLEGRTDDLEVQSSGTGSFDGGDLEAVNVVADASGVGSVIVWATSTFEVDASGIGSVQYYGSPSLNANASGLGSLNSLGDK